jgi:hypothetical protein
MLMVAESPPAKPGLVAQAIVYVEGSSDFVIPVRKSVKITSRSFRGTAVALSNCFDYESKLDQSSLLL